MRRALTVARVGVLVGVLLAGCDSAGVEVSGDPSTVVTPRRERETVEVLFAKERIPAGMTLGTAIKRGKLVLREINRRDVLAGALPSPDELIVAPAKADIEPGQQLTRGLFGEP